MDNPELMVIGIQIDLDSLEGPGGLVDGLDYAHAAMLAAHADPDSIEYQVTFHDFKERGEVFPGWFTPDLTITMLAARLHLEVEPDWMNPRVRGMAQDHEWGLIGGRDDAPRPGLPNPPTLSNPPTLPTPRGWDTE
jgi:hypothetical protein